VAEVTAVIESARFAFAYVSSKKNAQKQFTFQREFFYFAVKSKKNFCAWYKQSRNSIFLLISF
jgi:hypothetical protein